MNDKSMRNAPTVLWRPVLLSAALSTKVAQEGLILTEDQVRALEKAREEKEAHGEIETEHPGYLGSQDTYYVGNLKGVGRIYQQTFIDTYTKVAFVKLYDRKHAITAADTLNDQTFPSHDAARKAEERANRALPACVSVNCGGFLHESYW